MTNDLITRLRDAAAEMRRGVHTPAHIALMLEAAKELSKPKITMNQYGDGGVVIDHVETLTIK